MALLYLSLGSNQGDRLNALVKANKQIDFQIGKVRFFSAVFESEPWGFSAPTTFYNQALVVETKLDPRQVLDLILEIEKGLGRLRTGKEYSSRIIDIDILFYDNLIISEEHLTIPHPHLHKRKFVLVPLETIAPDLIHPGFQVTIKQMLNELADAGSIHIACSQDAFAGLLVDD